MTVIDMSSRLNRIRAYGGTAGDLLSRLKLSLVGAVSRSTQGNRAMRAAAGVFGVTWLRPAALHGMTLAVNPLDWSETLVFEEIFIAGAYDLRLVPFQPNRVVDCGAHIGMFSLMAAARWPGIQQELFEPNPKNVLRLKLHQARNRLTWQLNEGVVAAVAGEVALEVPQGNSHAARIRHLGEAASSSTVRVPAWSLAERLQRESQDGLVLKLDIEGAERDLWAPMLAVLPSSCAIFFETHHGNEGWDLAASQLQSAGFAVSLKSDRGQFKDGFALRAGNS